MMISLQPSFTVLASLSTLIYGQVFAGVVPTSDSPVVDYSENNGLHLLDYGIYPSKIGDLITVERIVALHVHYKFNLSGPHQLPSNCQHHVNVTDSLEQYIHESLDEYGVAVKRPKRFISAVVGLISGAIGLGMGVKNYITESHIAKELERLKTMNEELMISNTRMSGEIQDLKAMEELMIIKQSKSIQLIFDSIARLSCEVDFIYKNVVKIVDFVLQVKRILSCLVQIDHGTATSEDLYQLIPKEEIHNTIAKSLLLPRSDIARSVRAATIMSGKWNKDKTIYSFIIWIPICKETPLPIFHLNSVGYHSNDKYMRCQIPHHLVVHHKNVYKIQVTSCIVRDIRNYFCPPYARQVIQLFSYETLKQYCTIHTRVSGHFDMVILPEGLLFYAENERVTLHRQDLSGFDYKSEITNTRGAYLLRDENVTAIIAGNAVIFQRIKMDRTLYIPQLTFTNSEVDTTVWNTVGNLSSDMIIRTVTNNVEVTNVYVYNCLSLVLSIVSILISIYLFRKSTLLVKRVNRAKGNDIILA